MLDNQWGFLLWLEEKPNVPEGSVHVMCPPALCSRDPKFTEIVAKSTGISKFQQLDRSHNESVST